VNFQEQLDFFRRKLDIPTQRWDDLMRDAHDRAFVVASAMQADLLADLRAAVDRGIAEGATLEDFRKDFDVLVEKHGWTGWTGEGSEAGRAWRTRVIYETNLRTSYAAGRYRQLQDQLGTRPYWRYRHNDTVLHPRPHHVALDGRVVRGDDPWWNTYYPPNGWGCRCFVESLSERDLKRLGLDEPEPMPEMEIDPVTGLPIGIDRGWDYAPGRSAADELKRIIGDKAKGLPKSIRSDWGRALLGFLVEGAGGLFKSMSRFIRKLFGG
jgi:uncharacterized protein with gpF-like domain